MANSKGRLFYSCSKKLKLCKIIMKFINRCIEHFCLQLDHRTLHHSILECNKNSFYWKRLWTLLWQILLNAMHGLTQYNWYHTGTAAWKQGQPKLKRVKNPRWCSYSTTNILVTGGQSVWQNTVRRPVWISNNIKIKSTFGYKFI